MHIQKGAERLSLLASTDADYQADSMSQWRDALEGFVADYLNP